MINFIFILTLLLGSILLMSVPYIKPILRPLKVTQFQNECIDNVCLQTTGATCGPASLATIFRFYNLEHSEQQIAKSSYTSSSGTEIWYLARFAKSHGLNYNFLNVKNISDVKPPAIIGVNLGFGVGHFVTVLDLNEKQITIGEPLSGKQTFSASEFNKEYEFTNFVMSFSRK